MNIYKIITIFMFCTFFASCEKNTKTNSLKMDFDIVVRENDPIQVFYSNNSSVEFNEKQSYWINVEGSKKKQAISFTFLDTIKPEQIRIDFGRNKKQPEIILNEIAFFIKKKKLRQNEKKYIFYLG